MRRPRHKLQISTFPFLAVLLGAMGALIFLLLVMDRRAKIVARNKVRDALEARQAAVTETERQRQKEWERQRRQLHELLASQDRQLRGDLQSTLGEVGKTTQKLQAKMAAHAQLQAQIDAEQSKLMRERHELQERQTALLQDSQVADASKSELARLTRELLELEHTLDAMKRLKQQQQPTYSLVPYRGQRGANRLPIYVECTRDGLAFLPDGDRLIGDGLDLSRIRTEVERRHGPLIKQKKLDPFRPNPADEQPYVLFLIRPDGVGSYYRGQNALRGFQIDFGYELVDADWKLDVPNERSPLPVAQLPASDRNPVPRLPQGFAGQRLPGMTSAGAGGLGVGPSGGATLGAPNVLPPGPRSPNGNDVGNRDPAFPRSPGGYGPSSDSSIHQGPGLAKGPVGFGSEPTTMNPPAPTLAGGAPAMNGAANLPGHGSPSRSSEPAPAPFPKTPGASNPAGSAPGAATPAATLTFRPASPESKPNLEGPGPGGSSSGAAIQNTVSAADGASAKRQGGTEIAGAAPSGSTEAPAAGNAMARLAAPLPATEKKPRPGPVSLSRVVGNRDFIITLACHGEGVVLTPGGATFVWNAKAEAAQTDERLVRAVVDLVNRRQATVRPGEPPYRPVLRFEVREQGRRNYHHVFPLLENLRIPMVREDVEE